MSAQGKFKPKILGFVCNWCCYGGADLAGVSRFQYPPYIRLIRIMCSARVDLGHIFRAFAGGQDGVFVGGCHLGDCHYITNGNYDALSMVHIGKKILGHLGVNPERLRLEWVSAGEGIRFANIMNEFGPQIERLGPVGSSEGTDEQRLKFNLKAAALLVPYIRLVLAERMRVPVKSEQKYRAFFSSEEAERLFEELILDKLVLSRIMLMLREKPSSPEQIASALGLDQSEIARHLNISLRQGLASFDGETGRFRST